MSSIKVFCRVRPHKRASRSISIDTEDKNVAFEMKRDNQQGRDINNSIQQYKFKFDGVFDESSTQSEIFDKIAKDIINGVLDGYNGTIFAYGQTGSGKTYTITGGPEKYEERGIIPRAIEYIFSKFEEKKDARTSIQVSYLEIYNNSGYDLLDPNHEGKTLNDLPKVSIKEADDGKIHMSNIATSPVATKEDALNLLFVGDTNRVICETPMNDTSSRSHCIFTINVQTRPIAKQGKVVVSKLHLVDLAGSERTKKTNVNGKIFNEACHINLSLHYLEQVIVALHDKSKGRRSHVPYRNSMMTSVLRDSLGGNCRTCMIATCSPVRDHIGESISTCKFAQRVAKIKNNAKVNEEIDPKLVIKALNNQIRELKEELDVIKGTSAYDGNRTLNVEETERCIAAVVTYIKDAQKVITYAHPAKVRCCYALLRREVLMARRSQGGKNETRNLESWVNTQGEIDYLRKIIKERDDEIVTLKARMRGRHPNSKSRAVSSSGIASPTPKSAGTASRTSARVLEERSDVLESVFREGNGGGTVLAKEDKEALERKQDALIRFKKSYSKSKEIEDQKEDLKTKYMRAQTLGKKINAKRDSIKNLTQVLQRSRKKRGVQEQLKDSPEQGDDKDLMQQEATCLQSLREEKQEYKQMFLSLKELKQEIEHLHHGLEKSRRRLQRDFEDWWKKKGKRSTTDDDIRAFYRASLNPSNINISNLNILTTLTLTL
ncbi:hypothetical protein AAMO2058_001466900 [Amorphochlora amoebiformis]